MKHVVTVLGIGLLVCTLLSADGWAQATAQISGTVRDQSGAVLPGVEVTATQTATGIARNTVTNETGSYVLTNLPVGPYKVEAGLPGFRTFVQTEITLIVNASLVINPRQREIGVGDAEAAAVAVPAGQRDPAGADLHRRQLTVRRGDHLG